MDNERIEISEQTLVLLSLLAALKRKSASDMLDKLILDAARRELNGAPT